jgi:hypothetical protein
MEVGLYYRSLHRIRVAFGPVAVYDFLRETSLLMRGGTRGVLV